MSNEAPRAHAHGIFDIRATRAIALLAQLTPACIYGLTAIYSSAQIIKRPSAGWPRNHGAEGLIYIITERPVIAIMYNLTLTPHHSHINGNPVLTS